MKQLGERALAAKAVLAQASTALKNTALKYIAQDLRAFAPDIIAANKTDMENGRANGMNDGLLDRLMLDESRIDAMARGVEEIIALDDPVGKTLSGTKRENGLEIHKVTVPLGVVGIIYEARPNVTCDAGALCLKSGNAVILRGGKEAFNSNAAIVNVMSMAVQKAGLPGDVIQLVTDTSRKSADEMMKMNGYIDVLIPRGGAGLIKSVVENATVPIIETGTGNCHVYVDSSADLDMAANIVYNAKTSRISVCNSCESLVIHKDIAQKALPLIKARLDEKNVEIRGDEETVKILPDVKAATQDDFAKEYLDYIISVKVVSSLEEAVAHINRYSTGHSECIVTNDYNSAMYFTSRVDSAAVYVNASTRFTDGGVFGEGAEIGISTQKLHARGPMGLNQLVSVKFIVFGNGQVR